MAITHIDALRNGFGDLVDDRVNTGTTDPNGELAVQAGATDLVVFQLSDPAFGAAASGVITLNGVPITQAAIATGDADSFELRDKDNANQISGTVTATGGGGDITLDNVSIADGQNVTLNSLTWTAPQ